MLAPTARAWVAQATHALALTSHTGWRAGSRPGCPAGLGRPGWSPPGGRPARLGGRRLAAVVQVATVAAARVTGWQVLRGAG